MHLFPACSTYSNRKSKLWYIQLIYRFCHTYTYCINWYKDNVTHVFWHTCICEPKFSYIVSRWIKSITAPAVIQSLPSISCEILLFVTPKIWPFKTMHSWWTHICYIHACASCVSGCKITSIQRYLPTKAYVCSLALFNASCNTKKELHNSDV